ncbi:MAG: GGDEF domain-containing protein [Lachnospiraceae bacterium]
MSLYKKITSFFDREYFIIKKHEQNVNLYNKNMLCYFLMIFAIVLPLTILGSIIGPSTSDGIFNYVITQLILIFLIVLYKKGYFNKHPLIGLYIVMSIAIFFGIILSIYISPHNRTTILLGVFCILPLLYIDYLKRKLCFIFLGYITHVILAFFFKDSSFLFIDAANTLAFIVIGVFIGYVTQETKLNFYELETQLIFERETDILTGLKNKRKLFELFVEIEEHIIDKPSCAIMIDIDNFKEYNDTYGHFVGDEFLSCFGNAMLELERKFNIKFYRYGGEEIAAFLWDHLKDEQLKIAEVIRHTVESLIIEHKRTVSIGYVDYTEFNILNIENAIKLADIALYSAKNNGRNQVIKYNTSLSHPST